MTVFRTLKIVDGEIQNLEAQLKQLESDFGNALTIPQFNIPATGTYRLRITAGQETLIEIEPYFPPTQIQLTLYPEPVNGDKIKTLSYRNRDFIREYAKSKGCNDALIYCQEGFLTEASNSNFFFKLNGQYYTPSPELPFLSGLTIRSLNYSFEYVKIKPHELPREAKIFLCNSLMGVMPATFSLG